MSSGATAAVANVNDAPPGSVTIDNTTPARATRSLTGNTLADADGLGAITYQWLEGRRRGGRQRCDMS